jgi:hypothetical protein
VKYGRPDVNPALDQEAVTSGRSRRDLGQIVLIGRFSFLSVAISPSRRLNPKLRYEKRCREDFNMVALVAA